MTKIHSSSSMRWVFPLHADNTEKLESATTIRLVPELLVVGYQKYAEAYPIPLHCHHHAYEFVYLHSGSATWEINGISYPMNAGQWFYTRPGELHKARFNHLEPSRIWWMIVQDPEGTPNWFRLEGSDRELAASRLQQLPRVFRAGPRVHEQFVRLKATLETESPDQAFFARHQVLDIIMGLLQPTSSKSIEPGVKDAVIHSVHQLTQAPNHRYSVAELARASQMSESHFYKVFHDIFGQSPAAYMERVRMERACSLLQTNISITEIAFELGFKTSQHFTTVFRKHIGSSPSEWRKTGL
ncbi:helix-turn-helix domain-containing protein [Paenibacillus sp. LMG 31461]|uniref:Helix-turn-helix domain-containing protein n=1 Tax=Paenibacillus plantarum TaxID=2654975 RepID=A0ABX1X6D9_9BACL|nr:AraC family transcriptional regulator [Paenibacillus plantarum]NOU63941.1 helix-turn-helix domain-containing protein [Paenibacillus plantarum]